MQADPVTARRRQPMLRNTLLTNGTGKENAQMCLGSYCPERPQRCQRNVADPASARHGTNSSLIHIGELDHRPRRRRPLCYAMTANRSHRRAHNAPRWPGPCAQRPCARANRPAETSAHPVPYVTCRRAAMTKARSVARSRRHVSHVVAALISHAL